MHLNSRSFGLALLLLLLFLGAALGLQAWLGRETRQAQAAATEEMRGRLLRALSFSGRSAASWDTAFQHDLGTLLGGSVELFHGEPPAAHARPPGALVFVQELVDAPGWRARVTFSPATLSRLHVLHQRTLVVIVLLALLLALVPLLVAVLETRRGMPGDGATRSPWAAARAQAVGFEQLARLSHERSTALEQEHGARLRAEEDLKVNRSLLDHSVAERVRLGRELHDNICQTLYAVSLTLESVRRKTELVPPMQERLDHCLVELRRLNQEVRAYLHDLEPARIGEQSFGEALAGMLGTLSPDGEVRVEHRLDEEAVSLIPPPQVAEVVNILREAVSNSLRHGHPRTIVLRAARSDQTVALSVLDDGAGFAPGEPSGRRGHGLENMQVRAAALGGTLRIESAPGKGTRILLSIPVASPA